MFKKTPWGEQVIFTGDTDKYTGKKLTISAGKRLSLQHHEKKEETIIVISGTLRLQIGDTPELAEANELILNIGDSYHIPPKKIHRFCAPQDSDVVLIEVSTFGFENDVVRHKDDYNRV